MSLNHLMQSVIKHTLLVAAGFALFLQSLFPSGYMPGDVDSGWIAQLCPDGLPSAFVQQLYPSNAATESSGAHAHHQMESGSTADGHASHGSVGSCELGSGLDQPGNVENSNPIASNWLTDTQPVSQNDLVFNRLGYSTARARAPPTV